MKTTAILLLGAGTLLASRSTLAPLPASSADTCTDGPVPVVWPLGDTGFEPGHLYDSHGQFLELKAGSPYVHRGIDIAACVNDVVYAVESGTVRYVPPTPGDEGTLVVIEDEDEPGAGWKYAHLQRVFVREDQFVLRDQAIGTVGNFTAQKCFDHLHLGRVHPGSAANDWKPSWADGGNPLLWLAAKRDLDAPELVPLEPDIDPETAPESAFLAMFLDESTTVPAPGDLADTPLDVGCNIFDLFAGSGEPDCGNADCATLSIADQVMPLRVSFSVFRTEAPPPPGVRTIVAMEFNNVIDLSGPIADQEAFAKNIYRSGSIGTYTERRFLLDLTHCPETGDDSFTLTSGQSYMLQVVAEDASGNVAVRKLEFVLP